MVFLIIRVKVIMFTVGLWNHRINQKSWSQIRQLAKFEKIKMVRKEFYVCVYRTMGIQYFLQPIPALDRIRSEWTTRYDRKQKLKFLQPLQVGKLLMHRRH
ncbi:hypothetical protein D910_06502 [Dendroctonus ponderosae]|uniref:Uncharacterized protein n=1 Tax=Dendroctonus ponderosae TaxID=77166 RepID=U4UET7_DENPD|nr:hypothetical protein D910_06502 [Dendroctonus ponderosae]